MIVGGGIAGLAASIYLARGGRTVTLFEKRRYLGGRAVTHLRHGYRFNLGPHAFYRGGEGSKVLAELGIPVRGGVPKQSGIALYHDERHRLPTGLWSLWATGLLTAADKWEASKLLLRIRRLKKASQFGGISVRQWLDRNVARLTSRLAQLNARLRPHVKTAKSIEVAKRLFSQGRGPITVSTIKEAEYFAGGGMTDLAYRF